MLPLKIAGSERPCIRKREFDINLYLERDVVLSFVALRLS